MYEPRLCEICYEQPFVHHLTPFGEFFCCECYYELSYDSNFEKFERMYGCSAA